MGRSDDRKTRKVLEGRLGAVRTVYLPRITEAFDRGELVELVIGDNDMVPLFMLLSGVNFEWTFVPKADGWSPAKLRVDFTRAKTGDVV